METNGIVFNFMIILIIVMSSKLEESPTCFSARLCNPLFQGPYCRYCPATRALFCFEMIQKVGSTVIGTQCKINAGYQGTAIGF